MSEITLILMVRLVSFLNPLTHFNGWEAPTHLDSREFKQFNYQKNKIHFSNFTACFIEIFLY